MSFTLPSVGIFSDSIELIEQVRQLVHEVLNTLAFEQESV